MKAGWRPIRGAAFEPFFSLCPCREVEFLQKEDVERRRLEEAEKVHLAEIQGLQVRVRRIS